MREPLWRGARALKYGSGARRRQTLAPALRRHRPLYLRQEVCHIERLLDHAGRRPRVATAQQVGVCADQDYRDATGLLATLQLVEHVKPRFFRQRQVQQDDGRAALSGETQSLRGVAPTYD